MTVGTGIDVVVYALVVTKQLLIWVIYLVEEQVLVDVGKKSLVIIDDIIKI